MLLWVFCFYPGGLKIKLAQFTPLSIAGIVILISILVHVLSRELAFSREQGSGALVEQLEWLTYDARVKLGAALVDQQDISRNLATIFIDDTAIDLINRGQYARYLAAAKDEESLEKLYFMPPWPRFIYGQIVRELSAQGATVIGLDILFAERDEANPLETVLDPEHGEISSDQFFAHQLAKAGNVILATEGNLLPMEIFATNAAGIAHIGSASDYGVLRRVRAFHEIRQWHPLLNALAPKLDLVLSKGEIRDGALVVPRKPSAHDLNPEPLTVPLNPNGTLKLLSDGTLDVGDDPDDDGPASEYPFVVKRVWNLGVKLAAEALKLDLESPLFTSRGIRLSGPNGLSRLIPSDPEGYFYIDWSLTFEDLKEGRTPVYYGHVPEILIYDKFRQLGDSEIPEKFNDRIVLIGSVATGNNMSDVGSTPLEQRTPLVTQHVNVANSIITDRFVRRLSVPAEALVIALLGLCSALITWRLRVVMASIGVFFLCIAYVIFSTLIYVEQRWWLAMVMPLAGGLILPHFALVTYRVIFEQREQRRVRGIFSKIVSPDVVQELLGAEKLSLVGARRQISVYFADVRGFTEFTDASQAAAEQYIREHNLPPREAEAYFDEHAAETLSTVNLYLALIAEMVKKNNGTLDKYIGDCVMAFWGAPTPNPQHALCCVRAAVDSQRALFYLNQQRYTENERRKLENIQRASSGKPPLPLLPLLALGSGINTGNAVVGLMGSDTTILNYTVFGREVNLASRLEGVSGKGRVIISESTYRELLRDDPALAGRCKELDSTLVKGIRQSIRIYEVPWEPAEGESQTDIASSMQEVLLSRAPEPLATPK